MTQTLYTASYPPRPSAASGKLDRTCELVRASLDRLDRGRLLLPLLTTLVRQSSPRLQEALRIISRLRGELSIKQAVE